MRVVIRIETPFSQKMAIIFMLLLIPVTICASERPADGTTNSLNVSDAFLLHPSSLVLALPLFYVPTPKFSSSLLDVLTKQPNSSFSHKAADVGSRATFSYDYVTLMTHVTVGTPPQRQNMVLDTGSELSWLPCNSSAPSSFNPTVSSSYTSIPCNSPLCTAQTKDFPIPTNCDDKSLCHFILTYADGTDVEGNLGEDIITLPPLTVPDFVFGCSSSAPIPDTPGLMGLNRGELSFISQVPIAHKFSYCITDHVVSPGSAGVLLFGDSPFAKYMHYTPLINVSLPLPYFNRAAYSVRLEVIKVGNKLLSIPKSVFLPDHSGAGQTMIDSGTQFTLLVKEAYMPLKQEFAQQNEGRLSPMRGDFVFQGALDLCYNLSAGNGTAQFPQVTPVTLLFDSAEITLDSHQLLYLLPGTSNGQAIYCFTFGNSELVSVEANIIGNLHQQNLWVEYDLQNSRIGFARARCNAN